MKIISAYVYAICLSNNDDDITTDTNPANIIIKSNVANLDEEEYRCNNEIWASIKDNDIKTGIYLEKTEDDCMEIDTPVFSANMNNGKKPLMA
jgi:hypothetical protein